MSERKIGVATCQMACAVGDVEANLATIDRLVLQAARRGAQIVVLPELATTGYFLAGRASELADPIPGRASDALGRTARRHSVFLACGLLEREGDDLYNSAVLCDPNGDMVGSYRKLHLFSGEKSSYRAGDRPCMVDTEYGKLALTICYDLIFPEYIRSLTLAGTDILLNCTNWIADNYQRDVWGWSGEQVQALARTRALENGIHVVMADRVGAEQGWRSLGHSCIAGPSGMLLGAMGDDEGVGVAELDLDPEYLLKWRSLATYLPDRRPELYGDLAKTVGG